MDNLYIKIAGFNIKISFSNESTDPQMEYVAERLKTDLIIYLRRFLLFEKPKKIDFEIAFLDLVEIEVIKTKDNKEYAYIYNWESDRKVVTYTKISIYQFERMLKNIFFTLLGNAGGFGIHASCVIGRRGAYLFLGDSGAGKSTIAALLNDKYPRLSDDITFIKRVRSKYYVFQTPFLQKVAQVKKDQKEYELDKIFFINKSKTFSISRAASKVAGELVMSQILTAQNPNESMMKVALLFKEKFKNYYFLNFDKEKKPLMKLINSIHESK